MKGSEDDELFNLNWYPSEYFYKDNDNLYCVAIKKQEKNIDDKIIFGGSLMR